MNLTHILLFFLGSLKKQIKIIRAQDESILGMVAEDKIARCMMNARDVLSASMSSSVARKQSAVSSDVSIIVMVSKDA